ncbi:T-complex protein 1 subunit delta [Lathyrus oleraceus]|uniref:T-complex protein 1 subunit delta n=1 Tax=Pisum sativum TaxID=3888 RepID=UPI0021D3155B|nr:T-complex protein 1 subunit delta-like [Pisum sativum]
MVDLRDVKIVKKLVRTVDDTELMKDLLFDKKVRHAFGRHTRMENAKINSIVVSDYSQMDRILKKEMSYILGIIENIKAIGCNVLLIQKSILRDVTYLSLHYLVKAKILLSYADLAEELSLGDGKILKTSSTKYMGKIKTVLVCGSNFLVLEEGERSMHDALCVVRCLVAKRFFVALCGESEL